MGGAGARRVGTAAARRVHVGAMGSGVGRGDGCEARDGRPRADGADGVGLRVAGRLYVPVQFWAWAQWTRRGDDHTELAVSRVATPARMAVLGAGVGGTLVLGRLLDAGWDDTLYTYWDASIVAGSILAMLLMSRKKVESWWLWIGLVNVSAIGLYVTTGAYMFAALYVVFLVMAFVGLARWMAAARVGAA